MAAVAAVALPGGATLSAHCRAAAVSGAAPRRHGAVGGVGGGAKGCGFAAFSGLARERDLGRSAGGWVEPAAGPSRLGFLLVEAREPTRREKVKVRHRRIRKKLNGTSERPRLAVFRSNKHIYAQVIDDERMHTLASASTLLPRLREELQLVAGPTIHAAKRVGEEVAKACLEKGIVKVAFDRGGFIYHGRIKALADGAREGGLDF